VPSRPALPDRGPAAYIAEFVGTLLLVFVVTAVLSLYLSTGAQAAQFGTDFAVIGLVHGLILFLLIQTLSAASGAHLNPAITLAVLAVRNIKPIDAAIYILVQLSGGVAGALLTKAILTDEGRAIDYGAPTVSPLLGGAFQGFLVEAIGAFLLVFVFFAVTAHLRVQIGSRPDWMVFSRLRRDWSAFSIGMALATIVMVFGPLTGAAVNPARWFGPALVGNEFGDVWPYVVGPLVGAILAALFYTKVIEPEETAWLEPESAATAPPPPDRDRGGSVV
jgi:MIP family channel proteins